MKPSAAILTAALLLIQCLHGFAQGFINLDFESANLTPIPAGQYGGYVSITNAMPGWAAFIDGNQTTQVLQNNFTLGAPSISISGPNFDLPVIFQGNYSATITAGVGGHTVSISQTGLVPISAVTILFEAAGNFPGSGTFLVSLDGQNLNYSILSTGANYTSYGADISQFAGQTRTLTFSIASIGSNYAYEGIDAIQFSTTPIPEPSTLALTALATLLLGYRRYKNLSR